MSEIIVSFAYISATDYDCCCPDSCDSASDYVNDLTSSSFSLPRNVSVIKFTDCNGKNSRIFRATFPVATTVAELIESLSREGLLQDAKLVCFEPVSAVLGESAVIAVQHVLRDSDPIPPLLFCQPIAKACLSQCVLTRWLVVNILICGTGGELALGHVPLLVPISAAAADTEEVLSETARVLCLSPECADALRMCPVVACSLRSQTLLLEGGYSSESRASQIAILYSAAEIGDVVLVSVQWRADGVRRASHVVQGIVTRRFTQDGITFYDVKEVDTATIVEGLSCAEIVPL